MKDENKRIMFVIVAIVFVAIIASKDKKKTIEVEGRTLTEV